MSIIKSVSLILGGAFAGIGLLLSCGDNLGLHAASDAAAADASSVCDCPAAEPPLAGRFLVAKNVIRIAANDSAVMSARCPTGTQLITGGCSTDNETTIFRVTLRESMPIGPPPDNSPPGGWHCSWLNNEPIAIDFRATAVCLKPTP